MFTIMESSGFSLCFKRVAQDKVNDSHQPGSGDVRVEAGIVKAAVVGEVAGVVADVIAGVVGFRAMSTKSQGHPAPKTAAAASVAVPVPVSVNTAERRPPELPEALQQRLQTGATITAAAATPPEPVVAKPAAPVVRSGTLAVSSPTTVDIYIGDQLAGSAPTTIELPAGTQTVQYRHGDLRKVVTHVIKPGETTAAMINFDIPVQINAKPWAQVSIDGSQRQTLGQTPLSEIKVPIGSVLLFENPNFPSKTYRVTGRESEIRVNFQ